jgi:hypothetical protein
VAAEQGCNWVWGGWWVRDEPPYPWSVQGQGDELLGSGLLGSRSTMPSLTAPKAARAKRVTSQEPSPGAALSPTQKARGTGNAQEAMPLPSPFFKGELIRAPVLQAGGGG